MRLGEHEALELDDIDRRLLDLLQEDCRTPLVRLGEQVGLSAPSVLERIKKLEAAGIVSGYHAMLDAKRLGLDITAFIGVITEPPARDRPLRAAGHGARATCSSATTSPASTRCSSR